MKFLESEIVKSKNTQDKSLFHVIPVPMELSVSYKTGAALGPNAILEASDQLEAWDYSKSTAVIHESGIYTTLPIDCKSNDAETIIDNIEQAVLNSISFNAVPVLLGGEHTVTLGALKAFKKYFTQIIQTSAAIKELSGTTNQDNYPQPFGIVQIDAHADLRYIYQDNFFSHACVMRRAVDDLGIPIFQIGVRAVSYEEILFRKEKNIGFIDSRDIYIKGAASIADNDILPYQFPEKIYITLDVDGFDPSVIRATGTPVPGGLNWYDALILLENIIANREIIGFDVVELAPIDGDHASNFAAAQLVYSVMGMIQSRQAVNNIL